MLFVSSLLLLALNPATTHLTPLRAQRLTSHHRLLHPRCCSTEQKPISRTLQHCKKACDSISALVVEVHSLIADEVVTVLKKEDNSHFTLADGLVQALLVRLLHTHVGDTVGEEDCTDINISAPPFSAGGIVAPKELDATIIRVRNEIDEIRAGLGDPQPGLTTPAKHTYIRTIAAC